MRFLLLASALVVACAAPQKAPHPEVDTRPALVNVSDVSPAVDVDGYMADVLDERGDIVARRGARVAMAGVPLSTLGSVAAARPSPDTNPTRVTVETWGGIANSDGWCVNTIGTTPVDLVASKPARITAAMMDKVRFATIIYKSGAGGGADTRACVAVNPAAVALPCTSLDSATYGVMFGSGAKTYAIARDTNGGTLPTILASVDTGGAGVVCIEIGF